MIFPASLDLQRGCSRPYSSYLPAASSPDTHRRAAAKAAALPAGRLLSGETSQPALPAVGAHSPTSTKWAVSS